MQEKRIALVEDDELLLKRMAYFLDNQENMRCVLTASSLGVFFEKLNSSEIDLLLLDVELSGQVNSLEHLVKVRALLPASKIVIITGHNHPQYLYRALKQGANGFYLKGSGLSKLLEVIETTCLGGVYLDPEAAVSLVPFIQETEFSTQKPPKQVSESIDLEQEATKMLTHREKEIADALIVGRSYQEISNDLNISINTVRHHIKSLYKKFGIKNKIQLSYKLKNYLDS
ncbi:MAG TPA: response regulator transcription factor [Saprospiraceae bacterium]|mgnify:CR=1 FL=1|nr:response regulator transcription factor [Saprospiraceae bacterium]HMQ82990.1 response regulator transcription factor [Saprospiraceae bacterium]